MIAVVAAVVGAIGVAGCGDSGSAAEDGTSAAQSASPEVKALLLTTEELPAGFRTMPIPAGQVAQAANGVLDVAKGATISPPECAPAGTATDDDAGMVMLMAVSGSTTVTETVTPAGGGSLDDIRASRTGQCASVTATIANGDSTAAESTITNAPLDLRVTAADDVFAVEQTSTSTFNGREVAATTLLAWATVGDYAVTVTSAGAVADDPDVDTFEKTVAAAVDKVASAAS
ncbi:hypothetical protein GIY30_08285 [Gordonia sp. HNM0687]|uniref:DUF5642 domain-containing protein n=1 Tax=Gordonia mangrovi TaxID=2665643 RepID=A0A6L7GN37_9ACTN|nr:hypothetical protein [Gordonia mangrovi]MXP21349.1 hypothetical protein [Gordonia mangrovi]UVF80099.1 hypothetical protein NWF22_09860 [Gordonia mangrovi]